MALITLNNFTIYMGLTYLLSILSSLDDYQNFWPYPSRTSSVAREHKSRRITNQDCPTALKHFIQAYVIGHGLTARKLLIVQTPAVKAYVILYIIYVWYRQKRVTLHIPLMCLLFSKFKSDRFQGTVFVRNCILLTIGCKL